MGLWCKWEHVSLAWMRYPDRYRAGPVFDFLGPSAARIKLPPAPVTRHDAQNGQYSSKQLIFDLLYFPLHTASMDEDVFQFHRIGTLA